MDRMETNPAARALLGRPLPLLTTSALAIVSSGPVESAPAESAAATSDSLPPPEIPRKNAR